MTDNISPENAPQEPQSQPAAEIPAELPKETNKSAITAGMLCHLLALAGLLGIPFGNILGPFIIWLLKKNEFEFADDQGKESLNFQITMLIAVLICLPLMLIFIGFLLLPAVIIFDVVMVIVASMKANEGIRYRYPICIRLMK